MRSNTWQGNDMQFCEWQEGRIENSIIWFDYCKILYIYIHADGAKEGEILFQICVRCRHRTQVLVRRDDNGRWPWHASKIWLGQCGPWRAGPIGESAMIRFPWLIGLKRRLYISLHSRITYCMLWSSSHGKFFSVHQYQHLDNLVPNGMHMLQPVTVITAYSNCGWPHPQRCFKKNILQKLADVWCKATMQHVQAQTPSLFRCLLYHISTWFAKRSGIDTKHHHLQQHHQCFGEGKAGTTPSKHRAFPWDWIDPKPVSGV